MKIQVQQVVECNKVLYKMLEQRITFPISVGIKLKKIMKMFDEVEEYVFETMDMAFGTIDWQQMTEEQITFYTNLVTEEIELDYDKIPISVFENNNDLKLTLEEIEKLSIILE